MTFSEWIDAERGRVAQVANSFGITLSAVTQWRTNGVPVDRMIELRDLTGGEVTIEEMVARQAAVSPQEAG